jgi:hypothetical protein
MDLFFRIDNDIARSSVALGGTVRRSVSKVTGNGYDSSRRPRLSANR